MTDNVLSAIIAASSTTLTAVVALVLDSRGFDMLGRRLEGLEHGIGVMEADLKQFYKVLTDFKGLK